MTQWFIGALAAILLISIGFLIGTLFAYFIITESRALRVTSEVPTLNYPTASVVGAFGGRA
jgi:hypothetical protein